jgi:mono/diheme cytochrome c family protein
MLVALMSRVSLRVLILSVAAVVAGCGSGGEPLQGSVELTKADPLYEGAKIFNQRCSGCHTFKAAGAEGSTTEISSAEYKDGPNFNTRKEEFGDVLYAIRNGGFSSGPMPQNIVTGRQAEIVACFVATYSGKQAARLPTPGKEPVEGSGDDDCEQQFAQK